MQSKPSHPNSLRPIWILSFDLRVGFLNDLLPSGFPTKAQFIHNATGMACSMHGWQKIHTWKEGPFESCTCTWRIILKCIITKQGVRVWTGFICLVTLSISGLLWTLWRTCGFHNMRGMCHVGESRLDLRNCVRQALCTDRVPNRRQGQYSK